MFRVIALEVVLQGANQNSSKIGSLVHRPDLRGPPKLPGELDGRFHRVAVTPFCRQYAEQCIQSYGTTARQNNGQPRAHFYINTFTHASIKTVIRVYGCLGLKAWDSGLGAWALLGGVLGEPS